MAYDPAAAGAVLFGGQDSNGNALGDTWVWSGGNWTDLTTSLSIAPPARWGAGLTWDANDGYLFLFGGRNATTWFNDTWEFNGTAWSKLSTSGAPPPMSYPQVMYDAADAYVLLWGGANRGLGVAYNGTWTFQGGAWTNITPNVVNNPRASDVGWGAYDAYDNEAVFFGGGPGIVTGSSCGGDAATWTYANGSWTNLTAALSARPTADAGSNAMAYDPDVQGVVLFGGYSQCNAVGETWIFHGGAWQNATDPSQSNPPARWDARLAYDPLTYGAILFSGNENPWAGSNWFGSDTWSYGVWPAIAVGATPATGPAPLPVNLSATVSGAVPPVTVTWSFGDGSPNASGANVSHTYANAGTFQATATAQDARGLSARSSLEVHVLAAVVGFTASPPTLDVGMTSRLAVNISVPNQSLTFRYQGLPPGCAPANAPALNCTPASPGVFTIVVSVTASTGDVGFGAVTLVVNPPPSISAFLAIPTPVVANGTTGLFVSVAGGTTPLAYGYAGLPSGCAGANAPIVSCTPNATGNYTVTVTVTDAAGASVNASLNVTVVASPVSSSSPAPSSPSPPSGPSRPGAGVAPAANPAQELLVAGVSGVASALAVAGLFRWLPPRRSPPSAGR